MDLHEIKKKLVSKSERVKAVDLHPHESWVVAGLYTGHVTLWNFDTNTCIKTFDIVDVPIRSVKFIAREHWFICGADDLHCRIFNYNTMEKVHQFEAHQDYIRSVAVHPNLSLVLTSSDDMTVKLWDWSKSWMLVRTFEGHTHYVMCVVFNPKDPSTFATASLDHTVKVWNINSSSPNITLEHEKGVNCVHYYPKNDKPYLASGGDDKLVKIWDYQTKACIHTLSNHYNNVSSVWFHSELPLLITGSEDESFQLYDVQTFRMEKTLNFAMGRIWYLDSKTGNNVAIAMDRGLMVIGIGRDEPCFTMDQNGKIVISANREILKGDVRACVSENASLEVKDAEKLNMQWKELSVMEAVPYKLEYNCTGQFICVLSNGEYSINSALTWRPKTYGTALSFAWGAENGQYTVLEDEMTIKTFRNFKQKDALRLTEKSSSLTGGAGLIAVISNRTVLRFYDWEQLVLIRMVELPLDIRSICWSDAGTQVAIITEERTFLLQYKREEIANLLQTGHKGDPVDGFDIAFEMSDELDEKIQRAQWIGETLLFTTTTNRLCYHIAGNTYTVTLFDYPVFLLGYLYKENRAYFIDKERHVVSFRVASSVLEFKSIVTSGGDATEAVRSYASKIPPADLPRVGKFLEHQGFKELAMNVTTDQEHKFTLAIALGCLDVARNIAQKERREDKWRRLGDVALRIGDFDLAEEAFLTSRDCASLIMLYSALGSIDGMRNVSILAEQLQQHNIAFMAAYVTGDRSRCTQLLCASNRLPEAAVFSLAHGASRAEISHLVQKWKMDVGMVNKRLADSIADPMEFPNLFPAIPEEETLMSQSSPSHNAESGPHTSPWLNKASGTMGSEAAASINASLGSALGLSTEDPDTEGTTSSPSAFGGMTCPLSKADGSLDNSNRELDDIFGDVQ